MFYFPHQFINSTVVVDRYSILDLPGAYKPLLSRQGVSGKSGGRDTVNVWMFVCLSTHTHPFLYACLCVSWCVMETQLGLCVCVQHAASQETRLVVRLELPYNLMRSMEACYQPPSPSSVRVLYHFFPLMA